MWFGGVCGSTDEAVFLSLSRYEKEVHSIAKKLLRVHRRPVVIDVGGHGGEWLLLVKAFTRKAEIHVFEPLSQLAHQLERLAARNGWKDVTVHSAVAGGAGGVGSVHFTPGQTRAASTLSDFQPGYHKTLDCRRVRVDEVVPLEAAQRVAFLKIDVGGGELEVLQGAEGIVRQYRPPILLKLLNPQQSKHAGRQRALAALLQQFGYHFYQIGEQGQLTAQEVVQPDRRNWFPNFLAITGERMELL
jgi:FkbM family methyltransferase